MPKSIKDGDSCAVSRDVVVDGKIAFRKGDRVEVEQLNPNQQRPEYKYIVYSSSLKKRFQLSDAELESVTVGMIEQSIVCGNCNKEYQSSFGFCPFCGTAKPVAGSADVIPSKTPAVLSEGFPPKSMAPVARKAQPRQGASAVMKAGVPTHSRGAKRTLGERWGGLTGGRKFAIIGVAALILLVIIVAVAVSGSEEKAEKTTESATSTTEGTTVDETATTTSRTVDEFFQMDNVSNGQELTAGPAILMGTAKDKSCSITCNGQPVVIDPNTGQFSQTVNIAEGPNTTVFVITDADGKTYDETLTFPGILSPEAYRAVSPPLPSYKELEKNADAFAGTRCKFRGQVIQAMASGDITVLRINVTPSGYGFWSDTMYG